MYRACGSETVGFAGVDRRWVISFLALIVASVAGMAPNHGTAAQTLGAVAPTLSECSAALERNARDTQALMCRGKALMKDPTRLDQAFSDFNAIIAQDPKNLDALDYMAEIRFKQRRWDEAFNYYDRSAKASPGWAWPVYQQARILLEMREILQNGPAEMEEAKAKMASLSDADRIGLVSALRAGQAQIDLARKLQTQPQFAPSQIVPLLREAVRRVPNHKSALFLLGRELAYPLATINDEDLRFKRRLSLYSPEEVDRLKAAGAAYERARLAGWEPVRGSLDDALSTDLVSLLADGAWTRDSCKRTIATSSGNVDLFARRDYTSLGGVVISAKSVYHLPSDEKVSGYVTLDETWSDGKSHVGKVFAQLYFNLLWRATEAEKMDYAKPDETIKARAQEKFGANLGVYFSAGDARVTANGGYSTRLSGSKLLRGFWFDSGVNREFAKNFASKGWMLFEVKNGETGEVFLSQTTTFPGFAADRQAFAAAAADLASSLKPGWCGDRWPDQ